jgi:hypothetical protein
LAGSYVYSKSCGGPRVGKVTAYGPYELGFVTALFAKRNHHELSHLLRELDATQKDAVRKAVTWLDERPALVESLVRAPAQLATGEISMAPSSRGLLSRLFGRTKAQPKSELSDNLADLETMLAESPHLTTKRVAPKPDPKRDELRALVDEALQSSSSQTD